MLWLPPEYYYYYYFKKGLGNRRDMFVCLPTGHGKSICFVLLSLIFDHLSLRGKSGSITLVMMDQRGRFTHKGLSTDFVGELQQDVGSITPPLEKANH